MDDNYYNEEPEVVQPGSQTPANNDTIGIIGLVAGILSVILAICCYPLGLLLGVIAIVCGFVAKGKKQKFAVAGIVLGFIAIALGILVVILSVIGLTFFNTMEWQEFISDFEQFQ